MLTFWFPTRNSWDVLAQKRSTERFHRRGYTCLSNLKEVDSNGDDTRSTRSVVTTISEKADVRA